MQTPVLRSIQVLAGLALSATATLALAGPIRSVGSVTFLDVNTLAVADREAGEIHAITLPAAESSQPSPFNLKQVSAQIAKALHTSPERLRFEDLAFRPGTELAYISLSIDRGASKAPSPALVSVDHTGKVKALDLAAATHTSVTIKDRPTADKMFWNDIPASTYTVTDMTFYKGRLYVAGLSNASFASTLRIFDYPFSSQASATSVEMYHAVHNQVETRAPIRKMTIAELNGEPMLIAAYTCTPLVTIPLKDLKDGAHIVGKTVAELGWGSQPVGMVSFDAGQGPVVLLANSHKAADLMSVASIAEAAAKPGLHEPIKWPTEPYLGVKAIPIPLAGLASLAVQDGQFLAGLRRNEATGAMELVSMRAGAFLRVSDFVNEYDFGDFRYGPNDPFKAAHAQWRADEGYPNLAAKAQQ
ncbi:MAG TPA: hypothetical protein VGM81_12385 [Burkholderiaceae bacterium]|jgi:hypothetical protein